MDTPIWEAVIPGAAIVATLAGTRLVAEIIYTDFITRCMGQPVNQAAKIRFSIPVVLRKRLVIRINIFFRDCSFVAYKILDVCRYTIVEAYLLAVFPRGVFHHGIEAREYGFAMLFESQQGAVKHERCPLAERSVKF